MTTAINYITRYRSIIPLVVLRIIFGAVLFISTVRFIARGWVYDFYIKPVYHFPFFEGSWLQPPGSTGMYTLYGVMATAALLICIGLFYRIATPVFFLCFCYAELLDKTYYLNHYYLVTILSFLLTLVPAHRYWSLDVLRRPSLRVTEVPAWTVDIFRCQLCIVYFYAGVSKLTGDWLIDAMPLKIWLPAKGSLLLIGPLLQLAWMPYFFSWAGALFDLSVPFLLLNKRTRPYGYAAVIIFHTLTAILFQIGMFPYFMMSATLVFFSGNFFLQLVNKIKLLFAKRIAPIAMPARLPVQHRLQKWLLVLLCCHFLIQLAMPLRFLLYPGKLLWTEEGYRFSWRVMLMEKSGAAFFYVKDASGPRQFEVNNRQFLTAYQERMMETQPDMLLQYAHMLKTYYGQHGIKNPQVTVQCYVSLNGSGSRLYINNNVDLAAEKENFFGHKTWILPFTNKYSQ